jgi:Uma2 family endonuclease
VLSNDDTACEITEKIEQWLLAGCAAVWKVDPKLQTVTIYQSPADSQIKAAGETLIGDPVVPGFSCAVDELFQ